MTGVQTCALPISDIDYVDVKEGADTLIPASVIDGVSNAYDALDKIQSYAMTHDEGQKVKVAIQKQDKQWDTEKDINDITENRVIKIVKDLTGIKYEKEVIQD